MGSRHKCGNPQTEENDTILQLGRGADTVTVSWASTRRIWHLARRQDPPLALRQVAPILDCCQHKNRGCQCSTTGLLAWYQPGSRVGSRHTHPSSPPTHRLTQLSTVTSRTPLPTPAHRHPEHRLSHTPSLAPYPVCTYIQETGLPFPSVSWPLKGCHGLVHLSQLCPSRYWGYHLSILLFSWWGERVPVPQRRASLQRASFLHQKR